MTTQTTVPKLRTAPPVMIGFVGMILVPLAIVIVANSWTAPDAADYVRMAFSTVIASLVAVASAWWLAVNRMKAGGRDRYWYWALAVIFTFSAFSSINAAAERLTQLITLP